MAVSHGINLGRVWANRARLETSCHWTASPANFVVSVSLRARNLTDTTYATYDQSSVGDIQVTLAPPLTFGGALRFEFR